jgi:hypothetical protein
MKLKFVMEMKIWIMKVQKLINVQSVDD